MYKSGSLVVLVSAIFLLSILVSVQAQTCTDSDGGQNIYIAGLTDGRVNGIGSYFNDVCVTSNGGAGCSGNTCTAVAEGYCQNGTVTNYLMQCPGLCVNGACSNTTTPSPSPAPTITVTSPNGGQSWQLGSTQTITWTSSGTINYVMLDLIDTVGQFKVTNLVNVQGNPGSASWSIPTYVPTGSYKMRISTCTWLTSKDTCDQSKADVYDLSDSYFSLTSTVSGCSTNSDCAVPNPSWAGATFCDSTGLKLMQYRQSPTCQSGTCIYTTSESAVKEDCSSSGKICDFTTAGGGVYACVSGTPPNACPQNTLLATKCVCGSNYLDSYNLEHFPPHYCCGSGSNLNLVGGGTCPTPNPTYTKPTSNQTNQTNYTSSPTYSPSPITITPTYPSTTSTPYQTYSPPSPSVYCNIDQDCSWLITNGCTEASGASWSCSSLLSSHTQIKSDVCPQSISPRPSANCGCAQNNCIVYEEKTKPREPAKKIGNTEFDTTGLLSTVIQMEQLTVKFDFLKSATIKLSNYYNATNNKDSSAKWLQASQILQSGIDKIEFLKDGIRSKLSSFSVDDLRQLKKDVRSVIELMREIVKVVLGVPSSSTNTPIGSPREPTNQTNTTTPSAGGGGYGFNITNQTNASSGGSGSIGDLINKTNSSLQQSTNITIISQSSCIDRIKNGPETDIDCGGGLCAPCAYGKSCLVNSDCSGKFCLNNKCTTSPASNQTNQTNGTGG